MGLADSKDYEIDFELVESKGLVCGFARVMGVGDWCISMVVLSVEVCWRWGSSVVRGVFLRVYSGLVIPTSTG